MAKAAKIQPPVHPGVVLKMDLLDPLGMSINCLAKEIKVPANRLSQVVRGERGITADTSLRLARYFGFTPEYWLNMQAYYDLERVRRQSIQKIEREIKPRAAARRTHGPCRIMTAPEGGRCEQANGHHRDNIHRLPCSV